MQFQHMCLCPGNEQTAMVHKNNENNEKVEETYLFSLESPRLDTSTHCVCDIPFRCLDKRLWAKVLHTAI